MKIIHFSIAALVIFITVFATSSSCKKKKKFCESGSTCRSVLEAKEFFLFKEGSWWVYEEETTHERDSQYVYAYNNTTGYDFDMRIHSTLENYDYHYWPEYAIMAEECSQNVPVSRSCLRVYKNKGKIGNYVGEGICFFVNYPINGWFYNISTSYPYNRITVTNIYSTYNYSSNVYSNVVELTEVNTLIENNQRTKHYYVKNIGLIRKELIDSNEVWNLVNYHIEQ